jgi:hypothetical protein
MPTSRGLEVDNRILLYTIEYMKKQQGPKQVVVCTRVPEKVKEALESMALKKGVNLGEFLRWHLIEFAEGQEKKG